MNIDEKKKLLEEVHNAIVKCRKCPLYKHRTNPVPGEGPVDASVMLVGEAPGRNEDIRGRPFVGRAGELLNELLEKAGLLREQVFITNVVKCRPPNNRDPRQEEIRACLPYLRAQIRIISPSIIICLGRFAASTIFGLAKLSWTGMYRMHGKVYRATIEGVHAYLLPTFHPASAFYKQDVRKLLERDFGEVLANIVAETTGNSKRRHRSLLDYI